MSESNNDLPYSKDIEATPPFTKEVRTSKNGSYEFYSLNVSPGRKVKVVFRAPEEMIDPDVIHESKTILIGEEPRMVPGEVFSEWKRIIDKKAGEENGEQLYITTRSIQGILGLINSLSPDSVTFQGLYQSVASSAFDSEVYKIIDAIIASRLIDEYGNPNLENPSNDAEALVVASLLGNEQAVRKVEFLKEKYEETRENEKNNSERSVQLKTREVELEEKLKKYPHAREFSLDDFVVVHCTKYLPTHDKNSGKFIIKTLYDATKGERPRTTLHFTLNHAVSSHMYGNWSEMGIVVLCPLADFIKNNGKPEAMQFQDTYWNLNPGQDIVLPESTTVLLPEDQPVSDNFSELTIKRYSAASPTALSEIRSREKELGKPTIELLDEEDMELKKIGAVRDAAADELISSLGYGTYPGLSTNRSESYRGFGHDDLDGAELLNLFALKNGIDIMRHAGSPTKQCEDVGWNFLNDSTQTSDESFSSIRNKYRKQLFDFWEEVPPQVRRTMWAIGLL